MKSFWPIAQTILLGKNSIAFFIACVLSLGFSIAVILSTLGLMDGFEGALRNSLRSYNSDFVLTSYKGFYYGNSLGDDLKSSQHTHILRVEAFAVANEKATGVFVHGISSKQFSEVTGQEVLVSGNEVAIGHVLAKKLNVKAGDELRLILSSSSKGAQGATAVYEIRVKQILTHGIYEKDLRFIYLDQDSLREFLGYRHDIYNKTLIKKNVQTTLENNLTLLNNQIREPFQVNENWKEYATLIEAVGVEKKSIALILQIIVVVSIFNILAFVLFIMEKKSQDFFLLRSLGVSKRHLSRFWFITFIMIWIAGCLSSLVMTTFFDYLIQNISFFQLPGDVYVLSKLALMLDSRDYFIVFASSFVWVMGIGFFLVRKINKKVILTGLRQEFK